MVRNDSALTCGPHATDPGGWLGPVEGDVASNAVHGSGHWSTPSFPCLPHACGGDCRRHRCGSFLRTATANTADLIRVTSTLPSVRLAAYLSQRKTNAAPSAGGVIVPRQEAGDECALSYRGDVMLFIPSSQ